jgi:hypothetical protein
MILLKFSLNFQALRKNKWAHQVVLDCNEGKQNIDLAD